jgi:hypothetical protein
MKLLHFFGSLAKKNFSENTYKTAVDRRTVLAGLHAMLRI